MKIGILDDAYYSLQDHLLKEGHSLVVYVPDLPKLKNGDFSVVKNKGNLKQVMSLNSLIEENCDFYITATTQEHAYEILSSLGKPVLGQSAASYALEDNREFAKTIIKTYCSELKIPKTKEFNDKNKLKKFLSSTKSKWVIKQGPASPLSIYTNRTIVIEDCSQIINMLDGSNPWFNDNGSGGAILEEKIQGQEVCFGAFFDGESFIEPMYTYTEYKGAQDNDRGSVLTGEVGSFAKFHYGLTEKNSKGWKALKELEPFLKGKGKGLIDFNSIIDNKGDFYHLEFTMRFGRPTLEILLPLLNTNFNLGQGLYLLASSNKNAKTYWKKAIKNQYATAVTIFNYGYPLLENTPNELQKNFIGAGILFDMPKDTKNCKSVQFFCRYDQRKKKWKTLFNERQFVVVGLGDSPFYSCQAAYETLKDYWLLGHTWRNDVGRNGEQIVALLKNFNYIP